MTLDEVVSVVNKGARVLSADMCYPQNIRDELSKFEVTVASNPCKFLVAETQKLVESCKKKADPEKFYAKFFEMMPFKTEKFFPSLSQKAGMLLILKFADCLLSLVKEKLTKKDTVSSMQVHKKVLSDKEHHALEYLSGYVLHNLQNKIKRAKTWDSSESQQALEFINSARSDTPVDSQKLVTALNRGGLCFANENMLQIFKHVELYFREATLNERQTINCLAMTDTLMKDMDIRSKLNQILEDCQIGISKEIAEDTMHKMLLLYTKVRSFSFVKDINQKYKLKESKLRDKALRNKLKKSNIHQTV